VTLPFMSFEDQQRLTKCAGEMIDVVASEALTTPTAALVKVAQKYRDDPQAVETLTQIVLEGSKPDSSHWDGEISSGMGMPANKLVINDEDAAELVAWILNLAR